MDEQEIVAIIATLLELSKNPDPIPTSFVVLRYRENLRMAKEQAESASLGS